MSKQAQYTAIKNKAIEAGFKHAPGPGFWKALHAYVDKHPELGTYPGGKVGRPKKTEPVVICTPVPDVESKRERKNRLERERRARLKAAKA